MQSMGDTRVSIEGEDWLINGRVTYEGRAWRGRRIEGLLLNSRMVQATFDDLNAETRSRWNYPDGPWDPDRNTQAFLDAMATWRDHGLLAFTVNCQGGNPYGYSDLANQTWHNSAFTDDGAMRPAYFERMARVLDRADELGMVVILGYFYFGQTHRFIDEAAIVRAADGATDWLLSRGDRHVVVEIANECDIIYKEPIILPPRAHELIERVKERSSGRLLVSTSFCGGALASANVLSTADFVLLHGNSVDDPARLGEIVRLTRDDPAYRGQPILVNEDDHFNFDQPMNHFVAAVSEHASWGLFDYRMKGEGFADGYQSVPADWGISSPRKRGFFKLLKEITGA